MVALRKLVGLLLGVALVLAAGQAWAADHVVVTRHVTLREAPTRQSAILAFPDIDSALDLRDDGVRTRGYYSVELPNGVRGWIYHSFVARRAGPPPWRAAAASTVPGMAVHYIDVDQGAATLVETPCGAIMIDAGGRTDEAGDHLLAYLQAFFARRPDLNQRLAAVFVTHTHIDHNRFLRRVAETFSVGGYVHNGRLNGSGRAPAQWMAERAAGTPGIPAKAISNLDLAGAPADGVDGAVVDPLDCPVVDPKIRVLSGQHLENPGWPDGEYDNGNNHSLVIRIDYGEASFLFTGDLEEAALDTLVDRYATSNRLDVDVYAVGHHGSYNGTTHALMSAMTPEAAVISMGRPLPQARWTAWAYGHPRRVVVTELSGNVSATRPSRVVQVADGAKRFSSFDLSRAVYATGWDGDVVIRAGADGRLAVDVGN